MPKDHAKGKPGKAWKRFRHVWKWNDVQKKCICVVCGLIANDIPAKDRPACIQNNRTSRGVSNA